MELLTATLSGIAVAGMFLVEVVLCGTGECDGLCVAVARTGYYLLTLTVQKHKKATESILLPVL